MIETDLKEVKCFRRHANKPLSEIFVADSILKGLLKNMEATELFCLGLEPKMVQSLIHNTLSEFGSNSFVGQRQAVIYEIMYWATAHFEEIKDLELRQINKKGLSWNLKFIRAK